MPAGSEGACEALLLLLWRRRRGALTALSPPLALLAPLTLFSFLVGAPPRGRGRTADERFERRDGP